MDPNIDGRLKAIEAKLDQNQKILVKIRRAQRSAFAARAAYWIFLILVGLGAFYFIQPYISQVKNLYGLTETSDFQNINLFLKQINGGGDN